MSINKFILWLFIFTITMFVGALIVDVADAQELDIIFENLTNTKICQIQNGIDAPGGDYITWDYGADKPANVLEIELYMYRDRNAEIDISIYEYSRGVPKEHAIARHEDIPIGLISADFVSFVFDNPIYVAKGDEHYFLVVAETTATSTRDWVYFPYNHSIDMSDENSYVCLQPPSSGEDRASHSRIKGHYIDHWAWLKTWIPIAFATTTCDFITDGATTTASCGDSFYKTQNETQDIYYGYILFGMVFFGLIFFFKGRG